MKALLLVLWSTCLAGACEAKVQTISFADLVRFSDTIVVAEVTGIVTIDGMKVATTRVLHPLKGNAIEVRFIAQPTWRCDISTAKVGERALLCLSRQEKKPDSNIFVITHSGRGRIPLRQSPSGWSAPVRSHSEKGPWKLNIDLLAPKVQPSHGLISLQQLRSAVLKA